MHGAKRVEKQKRNREGDELVNQHIGDARLAEHHDDIHNYFIIITKSSTINVFDVLP